MQQFKFIDAPSHSAVAGLVTTVVSAWFLIAGATMVASPTDTQVAHHAHVTVTPGPVLPEAPGAAAAVVPDAYFTIVVEGRRA